MSGIKIFISYAPEDQNASQAIQRHLVLLRRRGDVQFIDQQQHILPGLSAAESQQKALKESSIIILILSGDFIASDECYAVQEAAIRKMQEKKAVVIPILYRQSQWEQLGEIAKLQPLPRNRVFISNWGQQDNALAEIAREIGELVKQLKEGTIQLQTAPTPIQVPPSPQPTKRITSREDLINLIAAGKTKETLEALKQHSTKNKNLNTQIVLLLNRWSGLQDKILKNVISRSDETIETNQINIAVLEIIELLDY